MYIAWQGACQEILQVFGAIGGRPNIDTGGEFSG
jgi:hypothetical protein